MLLTDKDAKNLDETMTVVGTALKSAYDNGAVNAYICVAVDHVKLIIVDVDAEAFAAANPTIPLTPALNSEKLPKWVALFRYEDFTPIIENAAALNGAS